jgi:hypothetical protein
MKSQISHIYRDIDDEYQIEVNRLVIRVPYSQSPSPSLLIVTRPDFYLQFGVFYFSKVMDCFQDRQPRVVAELSVKAAIGACLGLDRL